MGEDLRFIYHILILFLLILTSHANAQQKKLNPLLNRKVFPGVDMDAATYFNDWCSYEIYQKIYIFMDPFVPHDRNPHAMYFGQFEYSRNWACTTDSCERGWDLSMDMINRGLAMVHQEQYEYISKYNEFVEKYNQDIEKENENLDPANQKSKKERKMDFIVRGGKDLGSSLLTMFPINTFMMHHYAECKKVMDELKLDHLISIRSSYEWNVEQLRSYNAATHYAMGMLKSLWYHYHDFKRSNLTFQESNKTWLFGDRFSSSDPNRLSPPNQMAAFVLEFDPDQDKIVYQTMDFDRKTFWDLVPADIHQKITGQEKQ